MTSSRYIVSLTILLPQGLGTFSDDIGLEILNITRGLWLNGSNTDKQMTQILIVPANKRTAHELTDQLKALQDVSDVSVVELSSPIKDSELAEVRKIFMDIGQDVTNIPDDSLALYIEDKLQEEYMYSMIPDMSKLNKGRAPLTIMRTEDVPGVTPDMLKKPAIKMKDLPDRPFTKDDLETFTETIVQDITFEEEVFEPDPPPPPPPPASLKQMTDDQIRRWVQEKDLRKPKFEDIQIKRTTTEIEIRIRFGDVTETFSYLLKGG